MRLRDMTYKDYGIQPEEVTRLRRACRSRAESFKALCEAAIIINAEIADDIVYSLVNCLSYERISNIKTIPINRVDFYKYQMATVAKFKELMDKKQQS